jgi:high-affinity nickel-transport protein
MTIMDAMPQDWTALCLLVFVLGLKHGFDADHLATIDGLTRFNARANPRMARFCGVLFSLGHGAVVIGIALVVSVLAQQWKIPEWLETFGAWVSVLFLAALGLVNLHAVLRTEPTAMVQPVGVKGRILGPLFGRLARAASPGLVALVGALFALSFDTVSQAMLFALTASQFGGWQHALLLGLLFMLGMLVTDGINGLWISRLILRADQIALIASRVMSLVVAGISLLVAAFGSMKMAVPGVAAWSEGKELFFGMAVVLLIGGSFAVSVRLTRIPANLATAAGAD